MKKLTIVAASRNDDHGGKLLHRMQLFVNGLIAQCNRHQLDAELILVEWNPPADRPRLAEALQWPKNTGTCSVRIIEVPEVIHRRFRYSDKLPLYQMIAKNVGIRRAQGRFILATNIDILLSDELMRFLCSDRLEPGHAYRIDRYDVYGDISADLSINELLSYCRGHVLRVNNRHYSRNLVTGQMRWAQYPVSPFTHLVFYWHDLRYRMKQKENLLRWTIRYLKYILPVWARLLWGAGPPRLHMNACGDFTLMDAGSWQALKGYWEWEGYSMHLDSHLLQASFLAGVREIILHDPMRIYHMEHDIGSGYTPEGKNVLYDRLGNLGIPILDINMILDQVVRARSEREKLIYNTENWGLADVDLPETRMGAQ